MIGIVTEGFYGVTRRVSTGGAPGPCPVAPDVLQPTPSLQPAELRAGVSGQGLNVANVLVGPKLEPTLTAQPLRLPQISDVMFTPDIAKEVVEGDSSVILNCTPDVYVGAAVYLRSDLPKTVSPALAAAALASQTEDAIGIVIEDLGGGQCKVLPHGLTDSIFSGLLPGQRYFLSTTVPGGMTTVRPTELGAKIQELGRAASASEFFAAVESSLHPESGSGRSGVKRQTDTFTVQAGQTTFDLTLLPVDPADVTVVVNTETAFNDTEFSVASKVLTWLNATYALQAGDTLRIDYDGFEDNHRTEIFDVSVDGQTVFTLAEEPVDPDDVTFVMNGAMYIKDVDFTVVGTTVTWLNTDFGLVTGDRVRVDYAVADDRTKTDEFVATAGQTVFTLTLLPNDPANVVLAVNGFVYTNDVDFTIVGNIVTWLAVDFALGVGDQIRVDYEV